MLIESRSRPPANEDIVEGLTLIIKEFTDAIRDNNCELAIPLSLWMELENSRSSLQFLNEILPDEDGQIVSENSDLNILIDENYGTESLSSLFVKIENDKKYTSANNECFNCTPLDISFKINPLKLELKKNILNTLDLSSYINKNAITDMCAIVPVVANGCLSDNIRLLSLLLSSLILIIESTQIQTQAFSFYINGAVKASIYASIRDAVLISSFSIKKGECLAEVLNEIIQILPNSNLLDSEKSSLSNKIKLYNSKFKSMVEKIESTEKESLSKASISLSAIVDRVNSSISRVSSWVENVMAFSLYSECEMGKLSIKDSTKELYDIIGIINTLIAVIRTRSRKKDCTGSDEINTPIDIISILDEMLVIDDIIEKDKDAVNVIVSNKDSIVLDLFGCKIIDQIKSAIDETKNRKEDIEGKTSRLAKVKTLNGPMFEILNNETLKSKLTKESISRLSNPETIVNIVLPSSNNIKGSTSDLLPQDVVISDIFNLIARKKEEEAGSLIINPIKEDVPRVVFNNEESYILDLSAMNEIINKDFKNIRC